MFENGLRNSGWFCEPASFFPGPIGMTITFLFWGVAILLLFMMIRHFLSTSNKPLKRRDANHLNRMIHDCFAEGKLSKEEYERMKSIL